MERYDDLDACMLVVGCVVWSLVIMRYDSVVWMPAVTKSATQKEWRGKLIHRRFLLLAVVVKLAWMV